MNSRRRLTRVIVVLMFLPLLVVAPQAATAHDSGYCGHGASGTVNITDYHHGSPVVVNNAHWHHYYHWWYYGGGAMYMHDAWTPNCSYTSGEVYH